MVTVTNEIFKCFFLLTQKYFPDPFNDSFKDGRGYSLSIIIICNQMHYPTQNSISYITDFVYGKGHHKWTISSVQHTLQNDSVNCGIFVMKV